MVIGGVRHAADVHLEEMSKEGQGVIGLQAGTNRYATQSSSGVTMGGARHAADIRVDDLSKAGQGIIGLQVAVLYSDQWRNCILCVCVRVFPQLFYFFVCACSFSRPITCMDVS